MKSIRTFNVRPSLPPPLQPLVRLAYNLRWSWDHAEIDLFRRLDRDLWETCNRNPVLVLGSVQQSVLEAAAKDDSFLAHMKGVVDKLDSYISGEGSWYRRNHGKEDDMVVAYFSAEFGITECLSIFAGGLGVLAGRSSESLQRSGPSARGCRASLPARVFPAIPQCRRLAAGSF